ncbi:MAG: VCBS repeat-containing protein, partial [bacterium]
MPKDNKNPMSFWAVVSCLILQAVVSSAQVSWNIHLIHDNTHGTSSIYVCDLDNDTDLDVVGAVLEDNQMVWWRNEGGYPITWTKFIIAYNFFQAFSVYAADIDNDGDQDVIGAAGAGDEIAWWSNNGGNPIQWSKYTIRYAYDFAHEVYAHDLDMDGDMDVFGASTNLDLISWWRNDGGNPVQWTEQT